MVARLLKDRPSSGLLSRASRRAAHGTAPVLAPRNAAPKTLGN